MRRRAAPRFDAIAALIDEWRPAQLIVGLPVHADGTPHAMTARARGFARELGARFALPVALVDERWTSEAAEQALRAAGGSGRAVRGASATRSPRRSSCRHGSMKRTTAEALPDAEARSRALAERMRGAVAHDAAFVGIYSGGAWLAERLAQRLPGDASASGSSTFRTIATTTRCRD